jgi:hypothetical protein
MFVNVVTFEYGKRTETATAATRHVVQRGLAPRVFEYLFSEIDKAQDEQVRKGASSNVAAALP